MNNFKAYGPNAWAAEHGEKAIQTLDALVDIESRQAENPNADLTEDFKAISQMIDGEYFKDGAYPSILLASRTVLSMGTPSIVRMKMYNQARDTIKKKAFRVQVDYSSGHILALYILYHLRIMQVVRAKGLMNRPSNIDPKSFETDILACSFAAKQIEKHFADENGEVDIERLKKQDDFIWNFNCVFYRGEFNEMEIDFGSVKVEQSLPEILKLSMVGQNVSMICDHEAMQSNNAVITKLIVADKNITFETDAAKAKNLKAFKVKAFKI